jgi:hypothetical protein
MNKPKSMGAIKIKPLNRGQRGHVFSPNDERKAARNAGAGIASDPDIEGHIVRLGILGTYLGSRHRNHHR